MDETLKHLATFAILALLTALLGACARNEPLRLHPANPHYFLFRGRPTVLISSAEHYGAVLNADFNHAKYLDTLAADGMNHTRLWVGAYCEPVGAFDIAGNTLAPAPGRLICPWARSTLPGYANGGNRFDLSQWDDAYFARLKDFVARAAAHGIVVEVNLFCPFYRDDIWMLSPMNARNNVNGVGVIPRDAVYTLDQSGGLLAVQDAMVQKVVAELRGFDNIYYEVMNEPYVCKVPADWQRRMIDVIVAAEETRGPRGPRHLISLNIANGKEKVENPPPAVSILNFHYAWPPEAVTMNYGLSRVIGENETGGRIQSDDHYRREGWAFVLAGGGLYSNLDYSFSVGHEDGSFTYPRAQPGGGSATLRRQLRVLAEFIHRFDFVRMAPDQHVVFAERLPDGVAAYVLSEAGKQYAIYLCRTGEKPPANALPIDLPLDLPAGRYDLEWIDTLSGRPVLKEHVDHAGGARNLASAAFVRDVAVCVRAR